MDMSVKAQNFRTFKFFTEKGSTEESDEQSGTENSTSEGTEIPRSSPVEIKPDVDTDNLQGNSPVTRSLPINICYPIGMSASDRFFSNSLPTRSVSHRGTALGTSVPNDVKGKK